MTDQTPKHMQAEDEHHFGKMCTNQTEKEGTCLSNTPPPPPPTPLVSAGQLMPPSLPWQGCSPLLRARYQEYLQWCASQDIPPHSTAIASFEDYCASAIQLWWRRGRGRGRGGGGGGEEDVSSTGGVKVTDGLFACLTLP